MDLLKLILLNSLIISGILFSLSLIITIIVWKRSDNDKLFGIFVNIDIYLFMFWSIILIVIQFCYLLNNINL